ncbi:hypothetical protein SAMN06265365_13214 [Tistlia consotensis]|uniref:Uncharacterized protein n=1 Tax=Tistlia consotensis USBA 355 TaxID=560819 RepID=A0A1Y6CLP7_9PROT|nr:hypothetical protein [Tistlia consotensis]SMF76074.1 hypothetical protein SAMN05428998_13514 [Tistlia consotensis USBA 355]SNS12167.1 hypothetical protein SAMN06265365_13214 [Tistlia consotensis]
MAVHTLLQEPTVEDMLADPIVKLVMSRDGVQEEELRRIFRRSARARAERGPTRPGSGDTAAGTA